MNMFMHKHIWHYAVISSILFAVAVFVLGLITPGYNHFHHTISRLAIEKYGWIQIINFLQFSVCVFFTGILISRAMTNRKAKQLWFTVFTVSAIMWMMVGIFPTDKVEEAHISLSALSINGRIHLGIVFLVFILFPFGVYKLADTLQKEQQFVRYTWFTSLCGYAASILSFVWTYLFTQGVLINYLGLLQKIIAGICLAWMLIMLWSVKPDNNYVKK